MRRGRLSTQNAHNPKQTLAAQNNRERLLRAARATLTITTTDMAEEPSGGRPQCKLWQGYSFTGERWDFGSGPRGVRKAAWVGFGSGRAGLRRSAGGEGEAAQRGVPVWRFGPAVGLNKPRGILQCSAGAPRPPQQHINTAASRQKPFPDGPQKTQAANKPQYFPLSFTLPISPLHTDHYILDTRTRGYTCTHTDQQVHSFTISSSLSL